MNKGEFDIPLLLEELVHPTLEDHPSSSGTGLDYPATSHRTTSSTRCHPRGFRGGLGKCSRLRAGQQGVEGQRWLKQCHHAFVIIRTVPTFLA